MRQGFLVLLCALTLSGWTTAAPGGEKKDTLAVVHDALIASYDRGVLKPCVLAACAAVIVALIGLPRRAVKAAMIVSLLLAVNNIIDAQFRDIDTIPWADYAANVSLCLLSLVILYLFELSNIARARRGE